MRARAVLGQYLAPANFHSPTNRDREGVTSPHSTRLFISTGLHFLAYTVLIGMRVAPHWLPSFVGCWRKISRLLRKHATGQSACCSPGRLRCYSGSVAALIGGLPDLIGIAFDSTGDAEASLPRIPHAPGVFTQCSRLQNQRASRVFAGAGRYAEPACSFSAWFRC